MTAPNRWEWSGPEVDPWSAMSVIISGVLLWGGIGWAVSRWLNSQAWMGAGVVIGGVLGVLLVYLRYGRGQSGPPATVGPVVVPGQSEVTTTTATLFAAPVSPTPSAFETTEFVTAEFEIVEEDTP
jgi:ATP synthase protein I